MDLVASFRTQAEACAHIGSPLYAELLGRAADDIDAGGVTARVLRGHEEDPGPSGLALRLMGSVHRLVLAGEAPALAAYYPNLGGSWDVDAAWPAFTALLRERTDDVRHLLEQAPQTNEVGRAAALVGGLLLLAERFDLPVRLFEIGSSGGLNLRADHFRYVDDAGRSWGPGGSPVLLEGAWRGRPLPLRTLDVVERLGSDVSPVDATTEDGRLTLASYVWPDQLARFTRLRGAFEVAARVPAVVRRSDAASFVESLELRDGALTVLWHSVMWQYVPRDQRQRVTDRLAELGADATSSRPLAHLYAEPIRRAPDAEHEFLVCLETWPGDGAREILGDVAPHGVPVNWLAPE